MTVTKVLIFITKIEEKRLLVFGRIGGVKEAFYNQVPRELSLEGGVKQIACGFRHCLCLTAAGRVFSWGQNCAWLYGDWSDDG